VLQRRAQRTRRGGRVGPALAVERNRAQRDGHFAGGFKLIGTRVVQCRLLLGGWCLVRLPQPRIVA
jgi:hypothetical protein